mmetsp:Transcript_78154/g.242312  ORF Transcript_78154/g.242312 Transcript_78154/m.242312 type:complete len:267 (-) Transcript_78154:88-888(-)|eukprot:CAMPEP_0204595710 /NCGR_PEP_ID=MMETSP0661-20131031/52828_1 /ASSEMBLY_ACC=CAM_ASM_000606 /TAXON_ID=109239 /ORGANISM="Alexandrium margalefi, Strain AMGDE01CS-322" /LENGTH=266 /DNA_ID=CAMNT_0051606263 /DNA_START=38 /DNA_END=838 /DNA_ORIENTATION=+
MPIGDVHCVVFDLDDTLWHTRRSLDAAQQAMLVELAKHHPEVASKYGDYEAFLKEMKVTMSENPERKHDFTFVRTKTLERLTGSADMAADLMVVWLQGRNSPEFFPGALEALRSLRAAGVLIGTLTDGNADPNSIEQLKDLIDFSVSSVEAGAPKPDRRAYALCETKSKLPPEQLVMVGDNVEKDVVGAKAAGWRAVWVRPPQDGTANAGTSYDLAGSIVFTEEKSREAADACIDSVAGLEKVLRSWSKVDTAACDGPAPKRSKTD